MISIGYENSALSREVPAAVDNGKHLNRTVPYQLNDPVILENQLSDIVSFLGLWHLPSQLREILESIGNFKNALEETPSIIGSVFGDIVPDPLQVFQGRIGPLNPHHRATGVLLPLGSGCGLL